MAKKITGKAENDTGGNEKYEINSGQVVTRQQAVKMEKQGELPNYHIYKRGGTKYLRANPDNKKNNNIDEQKDI